MKYSPKQYEMKQNAIMSNLKKLIKQQRELSVSTFPFLPQSVDSKVLGIMISKFVEWDGDELFDIAYSAFEDSNCHSFNAEFLDLWKKPNYDKNLQKELSI